MLVASIRSSINSTCIVLSEEEKNALVSEIGQLYDDLSKHGFVVKYRLVRYCLMETALDVVKGYAVTPRSGNMREREKAMAEELFGSRGEVKGGRSTKE